MYILTYFFFPKQFTVGFYLRKKRLAASGRDMLWPRPRSLSALRPPLFALCLPWFPFGSDFTLCPPCVRLVSAVCPPCVRLVCEWSLLWPCLQTLSALCPPLVFAVCVSTICPLFVRHVPALCQLRSTNQVTMCSLLLACCGAGPWHHEAKFFLSIAQPNPVYIACPLVSFLGIHFGFGSTNSAFASAPYAWKTVWGLCWSNLHLYFY